MPTNASRKADAILAAELARRDAVDSVPDLVINSGSLRATVTDDGGLTLTMDRGKIVTASDALRLGLWLVAAFQDS